ncbi:MAG: mannose-1-phosphate guanylyltransferase/mannose-6-phosphate isomerase, partial [Alphaproteobacteria bacterium]|nr:mannose-1-phosphate guanylyltransferase/mannose-6-phosphate isomerase [Alphaproteobacteria bacterium]
KENDHIYIPAPTIHRIENKEKINLVFIEIQTGDILDENDIIRLEDIYNRV